MRARACGPCYACCVHLGIVELVKRAGRPCRHLDGRNGPERRCSVHGTPQRPACCEEFRCQWRQGAFDEGDRPDQAGLMVVLYDHEDKRMATVTIVDAGRAGGLHDPASPLARVVAALLKAEACATINIVDRAAHRVTWFDGEGGVWDCDLQSSAGIEGLDFLPKRRIASYEMMSPEEADRRTFPASAVRL